MLLAIALSGTLATPQHTLAQPSATAPLAIPKSITDKLGSDLAIFQHQIQEAQHSVAIANSTRQIEVTSNQAPILSGASLTASKEFEAAKGTKLSVIDQVGNFYAVENSQGVTGWVTAEDVKPTAARVQYGKDDSLLSNKLPYTKLDQGNTERGLYFAKTKNGDNILSNNSGVADSIYQSLTESAVNFREFYKNNPYLQVSGFTVHVGLAPSIDLAFTFR